jgi:hypothetical protein
MLNESPSALSRVVTSLKVVALAAVLGTVVLAAERQLATEVSPEEIVAADRAPANAAPTLRPTATPAVAPSKQAPADYFPSHFPAPQGEPAEQPPTF